MAMDEVPEKGRCRVETPAEIRYDRMEQAPRRLMKQSEIIVQIIRAGLVSLVPVGFWL